jgi:hypothetical protein
MTQESHDHNFKNLFADFPKEALEWILPEATKKLGAILKIEFIRQEPKKRRLSDAHLSLDMPILFSFEKGQILLWLVEFQEDKNRFSIYKLMRYVTDSAEAYPHALVIPTVLFTDRRKWRKDVMRELKFRFGGRTFLHFEYAFVKLFDLNAKDYYHYDNPILKILLPKMNYDQEERGEVIRQALIGLYRLVTPMLFDKYSDFIDIYAEIRVEEQESICEEISDHKKEETAMLIQYFREKFSREGKQEGKQEGRREGKQEAFSESLIVILKAKFGTKGLKSLQSKIKKIADAEKLKALIEVAAKAASPQEVLNFIEAEK